MNFLSPKDKIKFFALALKNLSFIVGFKNLFPPITMWRMTKRCNLKCKHCSHHLNRDKIESEKLLSVANKIAQSDTMVVLITGGEPLMIPNFREIIRILKASGKIIMINTNGYLLMEYADFLIDNAIDYIAISFDGHNAETHDRIRGKVGSFDKAIEAIDYIKKNRLEKTPYLLVRGVTMRDNFDTTSSYVDFFKERVDEIKFQPIHDYEGYDEVVDKNVLFENNAVEIEKEFEHSFGELFKKHSEFDTYYYQKFQKFIFNPKSMEAESLNHCLPIWFIFFCILEDGTCKTCTQNIGDIYQDEIIDIWNNKKRLDFLTALSHQGKCNTPCWMTCTSAAQGWQGRLIKNVLKTAPLDKGYLREFEASPNYLGGKQAEIEF